MKKSKTLLVCAILSGSVLFSSCIGSFGLWNSLKDWNQGVSNKFVNELIFLAFHIVPVYEIAYLADVLVLNSIEFWSGSNPTASIGEVKTVQGENGEYLVKTNENGYTITKKGEDKSVDLVYNKENNTWNAVADREKYGETYWHRKHQLPGVEICLEHRCRLENSSNGILSDNQLESLIV